MSKPLEERCLSFQLRCSSPNLRTGALDALHRVKSMMSTSAVIQKRLHPSSFLRDWREIVFFRDMDKSSDIPELASRRQPLSWTKGTFGAV